MIRVLIAEDSASARAYLQHIIDSAPDMEVVAAVPNGEQAVRLTCELRPDVIAMDIHMPVMDGYSATRNIMSKCPTPVVIVSSLVHGSDARETFRIMEVGAVAALPKPFGPGTQKGKDDADALVAILREMASVRVVKRVGGSSPKPQFMAQSIAPVPVKNAKTNAYRLVAIGASTGGPIALQTLLRQLPADFPVPIVVVQHISLGFIGGMVTWLSKSCALPVTVAESGEKVQAGHVYFAPDGMHMGIDRYGTIFFNDAPPVHSVRPAVSFLFHSVAKNYAKHAIGVLLTGMGRDGAQELLTLKQCGAVTLVQDQGSCVVYGMPGEAARLGAGDYHLSPDKIGQQLIALCR